MALQCAVPHAAPLREQTTLVYRLQVSQAGLCAGCGGLTHHVGMIHKRGCTEVAALDPWLCTCDLALDLVALLRT